MIFLRILVLVLLAAVAYCAVGYVFTRDRRYLRLAWRLLLGGLLAALVFFAVMFVERLMIPEPDAQGRETTSTRSLMAAHEPGEGLAERRSVARLAQAVEFAQRGGRNRGTRRARWC